MRDSKPLTLLTGEEHHGYLFSKPVPQAAFEQMLKKGSTRTTEGVAA